MPNTAHEIKMSDSNSTAITFAMKLLAGTLNFFCDYEDGSGEFREVTKEMSCFSTDVIASLRRTTSDMKISKLTFTKIKRNLRSMAMESEIRSYTLYARNRSGNEVEVCFYIFPYPLTTTKIELVLILHPSPSPPQTVVK